MWRTRPGDASPVVKSGCIGNGLGSGPSANGRWIFWGHLGAQRFGTHGGIGSPMADLG